MFEHIILPILLMCCGIFSAVCALKDMDWFMEHRKARMLVRIIGRTGTRVFYTVLGAAIFAVGAVLLVAGLQVV